MAPIIAIYAIPIQWIDPKNQANVFYLTKKIVI